MAATRSQGTTLKFTPAGGAQVSVGRLTSVGEIQSDFEALDVTTLESEGGYREYIQGLRDAGEVELSGFYDAEDAGQAALRAAYDSGAAGAFEVNFPDGSKVNFSGFVKGHTVGSAEVDGAIGFGAVVRITGAVRMTEAV